MRVVALACLLVAGIALAEDRKTYHGHYVISVKAETDEQLATLRYLHDTYRDQLLFLESPAALNHDVEIVVAPEMLEQVFKALDDVNVKAEVISTDVGAEFDANMADNERNKRMAAEQMTLLSSRATSVAHTMYRNINDVNALLLSWANNPAFAGLVSRYPLTRHSEQEGRVVYYVEVGTPGANKPVIFIEGLAHAREWIVTGALLYSIDTLLTDYAAGIAQAVNALNKYRFLIIPVVNPDGYAYTWTTNRLWRKNRRYISNQCSGVDLNRNFDVQFGGAGTSTNCRDDIYQGTGPFSEAETQNLKLLFDAQRARVVAYLSVHAYSQLLLYPWGYVPSNIDPKPPSNINQLISVGSLMRTALQTNGMTYSLGTAYGVLGYAAAGASEDWALTDKPGIYAYCYELRPRLASQGGFDIPATQIVPTGQELLRSLYVLAENI